MKIKFLQAETRPATTMGFLLLPQAQRCSKETIEAAAMNDGV